MSPVASAPEPHNPAPYDAAWASLVSAFKAEHEIAADSGSRCEPTYDAVFWRQRSFRGVPRERLFKRLAALLRMPQPGLQQDVRPTDEVLPSSRLHLVQRAVDLVQRLRCICRYVGAVQRPLYLLRKTPLSFRLHLRDFQGLTKDGRAASGGSMESWSILPISLESLVNGKHLL